MSPGVQVETDIAVEFLRNFFAGTKHAVELRALPSKRRVFTRKPTEIATFLTEHRGENLYFGVATREGGGKAQHCRELPALFADVDSNDADALKRIECFQPEPSIVNSTGGGSHVIWNLQESIDPHDARIVPILKGICAALGADPACCEIARVLRVPGTFNHKPEYGEPRAVYTLREDWKRRYTLNDFARFALAATAGTNGNGRARATTVEARIPAGGRHAELVRMAGTMRAKGAGAEEIYAALAVMNANRFDPPLGDREVREVAEDIPSRYMPRGEAPANGDVPADPVVTSAEALVLPDMPRSVLDGYLGELLVEHMNELPVAYAWPAMLAAASVLVAPPAGWSGFRANLYVGLVGPAGSGKTVAIERANHILGVVPPRLETLKAGSAEGLLAKLGDQQGRSVLLSPDELTHLLEKAQLTGASLASVLNSLFYTKGETLTIAHGKVVNFNCRLSIVGGLIDEKFDDAFGSATTGGLYDRFLFGQCPTGFRYLWWPLVAPLGDGNEFDAPRVDADVYEARDEIVKNEGISPRLVEIALRCAYICAAADNRAALRASDLKPALELARYQNRVRILLQPNAGKNFEARVAIKILNYLGRHAPNGEWIPLRQVLRLTRAYEFGPALAERAINAMRFGGAIDEMSDTVGRGQKRRLIRLAGSCQ